MTTQAKLSSVQRARRRAAAVIVSSRSVTYVAGVVALAAAYYASAKAGQTLRYTASVAAI